MEGKLVENFLVHEHFASIGEDEVISFERFYDVVSKWSISQEKLGYDDFAKHEDEVVKEEQLEAFKKMTDRIL